MCCVREYVESAAPWECGREKCARLSVLPAQEASSSECRCWRRRRGRERAIVAPSTAPSHQSDRPTLTPHTSAAPVGTSLRLHCSSQTPHRTLGRAPRSSARQGQWGTVNHPSPQQRANLPVRGGCRAHRFIDSNPSTARCRTPGAIPLHGWKWKTAPKHRRSAQCAFLPLYKITVSGDCQSGARALASVHNARYPHKGGRGTTPPAPAQTPNTKRGSSVVRFFEFFLVPNRKWTQRVDQPGAELMLAYTR